MLVLLIIAILLLVLRHTVWAEKLAAKEEILTQELTAEIEAGKLASSEEEIVAEEVEEAAEDVEKSLEANLEEVKDIESDTEILDEIESEELTESDPKLEDDISLYSND